MDAIPDYVVVLKFGSFLSVSQGDGTSGCVENTGIGEGRVEALTQAREARECSGGYGDGWCSRGRMFLKSGVSDRRRSDRWWL